MSFSVSQFLEKMDSKDKDIRHMALYDLHTELQKDNFKLDESSQKQVADSVLKALDDTSSEVQGMAVKCLGPFVKKLNKSQIESCVTKLSGNILKGEDEKRDIATLALKTVVAKIPGDLAAITLKKCLETLIEAVEGKQQEVKQDALEVLNDILARFGSLFGSYHDKMQKAFIAELASKRATVRKRANVCLATLSANTSDKLFTDLVNTVNTGISKASAGGEALRTYIQAISGISKTAGHRLGKSLDKIVPLLWKAAEDISDKDGEDEVREYIMQAFESFVTRCSEEVKTHVEFILVLCREYMEYDPNFSYDSSGAEDNAEEAAEDEDADEDGGDDGDEDDVSWKVRTAAVKCLDALIRTRPEMLKTFYSELFEEELVMIGRFKERTESVKLEVFNAFIDLLNQTAIQTTTSSGDIAVSTLPEISFIKKNIEAIVKKLRKQLVGKSAKVRMGVFRVLKKLVISLQGGMGAYVSILLPPIKNILLEKGDQNSALKLEVLTFLRLFLKYHDASTFAKHADILTKSVYERVNDRYYKITAEALRVVSEMVKVIAAAPENQAKNIEALYKNIYDRLIIQDIDQDVKESAIQAMGIAVATFGAKLGKLDECLSILLDRLKNEITRITACKTFAQIAEAKVDIPAKVLSGALDELAEYLKKFNRPLRQSTLSTLTVFAKSYGATITLKQFNTTLQAIQQNKLISDADLHLAHLALDLVSQILDSNPKASADVKELIQPKMIELLGSATLQGSALESSLRVLKKLVAVVGFNSLFSVILERGNSAQTKQVYTNVGKSIAAICSSAGDKDTQSTVAKFTKDLKSGNENTKLLALFTLGELGRTSDLSSNKAVINDIEEFFDTGSEELKNAASYALGNISVGSLDKILPHILDEIKNNIKRKYLLIHSLKEVISQASAEKLAPFVVNACNLLFENCENEEEGIRNVVSECLGKLALVDYATVIPKIKNLLTETELKQSAAISAIKFTITDQPRDIDTKLKSDIQHFLKFLGKEKTESLIVRRSAVLLLNSAAHNKPGLVRDQLDKHLSALYQECVFDKNLIKIIKLGPFNHQIDQGLDLRKSAFECLDTVLDALRDRIDATKFVPQVALGLADPNPDIKQLSHLLVGKVANFFAEDVAQFYDALLSPAKATLTEKQKENLVQQEQERQDELLRSTLKAVYVLSKLKGIEDSAEFQEINTKIVPQNAKFKQWFQQIKDQDEEQGVPQN